MTNELHGDGPRPEFRAHLEWQIETALRRETRFAEPARRTLPRLGMAVALLAAMAAGAVGATASGELQESRERDALVEAVRSEETLAKMRLELARTDYQAVKRKFDVGAASRDSVQLAESQMLAMEATMRKLALDIEEIRATAKTPRNDLQAPMVGPRDFVSERLKLDFESVQRLLVSAEQAFANAQRRFEVGLATRVTLLQAEADIAQARGRLEQLRDTLELRRQAVSGSLKAEDIAQAQRRVELMAQQVRAQHEVELARARIGEVRRQVETGQAGELDMKRAEVELLEHELELKRLRQEIEKLGPPRR